MHWTTKDMPSQAGKTAIVTGANSGIGFETAKALAEKGAQVILACRDRSKGEQACERIRQSGLAGAAGSVRCMVLDLADLASVSDFAGEFLAAHPRLDLLVDNAGVMAPPPATTVDGFEVQMATNHLGHFALTGLLFARLMQAQAPRIVVVSSSAHAFGNIDFTDPHRTRSASCRCACRCSCSCLGRWKAYGDSKIANLYFMHELHRRYGQGKTPLIAAAVHPGWTATNLQRTSSLRKLNCLFAMQPWQGALPTLYAATAPAVQGGQYIGPDGCLGLTGYPTAVQPSKRSQDPAKAARLWELSEESTGVRYPAH